MSNLKKDIEDLVKKEQLAHCCAGMGCETASRLYADQIINLIEKSEQKLLAKMTLDCKTVDYQGEQWNAILVKKLKNITFEQDEDIPNGAWGKNSLKKDIEEVLERFGTSCSPVATLKNMKNPLVKPEDIERATTQIINLIESVIPEEKKDDIPGVIFNQAGIAYFDGWNECIAAIKSKLIDGEKK